MAARDLGSLPPLIGDDDAELKIAVATSVYDALLYGLDERAIQDLEQGRSLPSRALVVLLKAVELDPLFMREVARDAGRELAALNESRSNRNL